MAERLDVSRDNPGGGFVPLLLLAKLDDPISVSAPIACNECGAKCSLILHIRSTPLGGVFLSAFCPAHADSPMSRGEVSVQEAYILGSLVKADTLKGVD